MANTLTATIAKAKLPNETMTQTLHRLRREGETITQTAGRLATGDIDAVVVEPELEQKGTLRKEAPIAIEEVTPVEEVVIPVEEELTPAQKAARTRAKNKAAKEAAEKEKDK